MVKPTPTQEENDLAATGQHVINKEADGSDIDHSAMPVADVVVKQVEAAKPTATYQTRQARPATRSVAAERE